MKNNEVMSLVDLELRDLSESDGVITYLRRRQNNLSSKHFSLRRHVRVTDTDSELKLVLLEMDDHMILLASEFNLWLENSSNLD